MDAQSWDERYAATESVWSAGPNGWVQERCEPLPAGRALDLACGEGRNALWLAGRGWDVVAADFSSVAVEKGRALEAHRPAGGIPIDWRVLDVVSQPILGGPFDLVVIAYLQLPMPSRRSAHEAAADALTVGGTLLVVAHHSSNLADGVGGPQDPAVLFTAEDVLADLADTVALRVDEAGVVLRPVEGADRPARDVLVRVTRIR